MRKLVATTAALLFIQGIPAAHAGDVSIGVSVSGEVAPGVYGRVDIGNTRPPLVYAQPVVIVQQPRPVAPVYMHVPPGHAKNWAKHCGKYNACARPVYFVKSAEYEPARSGKGNKHDKHDKHDKHGKGHGKDH